MKNYICLDLLHHHMSHILSLSTDTVAYLVNKCPNFKNVMGEIISCCANAVIDAINID